MTDQRLMGVRAAARELKVAPSTISRGIGQLYRNHGTPERPLVDLNEVIEARTNRIEPERQAAAYAARGFDLEATVEAPQRDGRLLALEGDLGHARLRKVSAEADRAEIDNLERQRALAPVSDFADAGFELAQLLRQSHSARVQTLVAAILAAGSDPGRIAQLIKASDQRVEAELAEKVEQMLNGEEGGSRQSESA